MPTDVASRVIIFHDETDKVGGGQYKGHVLLFVPSKIVGVHTTPMFGASPIERFPLVDLYQAMLVCRQKYGLVERKLHFTEISGKRWGKSDAGLRRMIELGVEALRHKSPREFQQALCCKISIMFYPRGADLSLYGGGDRQEKGLRHDETILRMLLKGAVHYLYSDDNRVFVERVVSDGEPNHRKLDADRVIQQIALDGFAGRSSLRDYVDFGDDIEIVHLLSHHKLYEQDSTEHVYANMLQLADMLLGAIIRSCYTGLTRWPRLPAMGAECAKKDVIAFPVFEMLNKTARGKAFRHSGHFRSFATSEVSFGDGVVKFKIVQPQKIIVAEDCSIMSLFS